MQIMPYNGPTSLLTLGFAPGDLLLEGLQDALQSQGILNGAVVSGIGTLKSCRMHYVEHTGFPPRDHIFELHQPLELLSVAGLIASGEPHLHIVVSCGENEVYGGHLHEGSEVLYLAEIAILVFNEHRLVRQPDLARKIKLLQAAEQS